MRCYLVIAFFDWKICVFQKTVVRVYCIFKLADVAPGFKMEDGF